MNAETTLKWRAYPIRIEQAEALSSLRAFDPDALARASVAAADTTIAVARPARCAD